MYWRLISFERYYHLHQIGNLTYFEKYDLFYCCIWTCHGTDSHVDPHSKAPDLTMKAASSRMVHSSAHRCFCRRFLTLRWACGPHNLLAHFEYRHGPCSVTDFPPRIEMTSAEAQNTDTASDAKESKGSPSRQRRPLPHANSVDCHAFIRIWQNGRSSGY